MEILNGGSFVPLDNREKIDQLIHTARELATEVSKAEGFQSNGQTNYQLGLEMWKGAEYVCRAHEEANIRNLFLSKFLERLREIEKERPAQTGPAQQPPVCKAPVRQPEPAMAPAEPPQPPVAPTPQVIPEQPPQNAAQDEYLGVVTADDRAEDKVRSYAEQCVPEYDADIEAIVDRLENEDQASDVGELSKPVGVEIAQPEVASPVDESVSEPVPAPPDTIDQRNSSEATVNEIQPSASEASESGSIGPIVLAEKEPYNFDACTVTAVVQLLPEAEGVRKCVVSVRTHDFAPMVAIGEAAVGGLISHISIALSQALEQYRNELPARVADKMKKEKPAPRKQPKSGSKSAKVTPVQSNATNSSETSTTTPAQGQTVEPNQGQRGLFAS